MFFLLAFGYDIRWCFAVSDASQKHTACALGAGWLQDVASSWKKVKTRSVLVGFLKRC